VGQNGFEPQKKALFPISVQKNFQFPKVEFCLFYPAETFFSDASFSISKSFEVEKIFYFSLQK